MGKYCWIIKELIYCQRSQGNITSLCCLPKILNVRLGFGYYNISEFKVNWKSCKHTKVFNVQYWFLLQIVLCKGDWQGTLSELLYMTLIFEFLILIMISKMKRESVSVPPMFRSTFSLLSTIKGLLSTFKENASLSLFVNKTYKMNRPRVAFSCHVVIWRWKLIYILIIDSWILHCIARVIWNVLVGVEIIFNLGS